MTSQNILVVDNEEEIRDILKLHLENAGMQVQQLELKKQLPEFSKIKTRAGQQKPAHPGLFLPLNITAPVA